MRIFAIGDIHGGLRALDQLLEKLQLESDDQLIFLGDYVDGWSESAQVIQYLIELSKKYDCIFIKGNHDVWCENWLSTGAIEPVWQKHGGKGTLDSYANITDAQKKEHLAFFQKTKLYHIDAKNRLFIHAGFTSMHGVEREYYPENFYYDRTLWEMALIANQYAQKEDLNYPDRLKHYKEIYIGHTPTIRFAHDKPMNALNVWNVDTGAAFTGKLSAIDIDTKMVYQSEPVTNLYHDEMGRNKS